MNTQHEPARLVGTLVAFAAAIFVALPLVGVQFDAGLPEAVENVIYTGAAVVAVVLPFIQAEITRRRVVPVDRANEALSDQARGNAVAPFEVGS